MQLATQWAAIIMVPFFSNIEISTDPTAIAISPKARPSTARTKACLGRAAPVE